MNLKQRFFERLCTLVTTLDPEVFVPLKPHQSKLLHIEVHDLMSLSLRVMPDTFEWCEHVPASDCHTMLSGRVSDFVFAANPDPSSMRQGNLMLKGDMALAQAFSECLKHMDWDWEALFADKLGDNTAHLCGQLFHKAAGTFKKMMKRRSEDLIFFAQDEKHLLPYQDEVQAFYDAVDTLKCDVDRLEAKIKRLV